MEKVIKRLNRKLLITTGYLILAANSFAISNKPTAKVSEKELVASVLVAEAGGEGVTGMKAVMEVIRTRAKQKRVSLYHVVTERNGFSCYNRFRNQPQKFVRMWMKHKLYPKALEIAGSYTGTRLTGGSNFYHERTIQPEWSRGKAPRTSIGKHLFFAIGIQE